MPEADLHSIPKESGRGRATVYAVLVHLALLIFLWVGVSWQNESSSVVEAEIWDIKVSDAAPKIQAPAELFEPAPVPEEKIIEPKQVVTPKAAIENPDIALEQEKKRKEEKKAADEKKKLEDKRKQEEKLAQEEAKKQKLADARKKQQSSAEQKARDAILAEDARRIAGVSGSGGSGKSAYSTGNNRGDASYLQKVGAKIKANTIFNVPVGMSDNQAVEYEIELLPDGTIRSIRKRKSSGISGFDEAVRRAIEKSAPFPPDRNGRVPSGFILSHKPKG